jgi:hypothetical protein
MDYGRFARLRDPEGNLVELWALDEPPAIDLHRPPEH